MFSKKVEVIAFDDFMTGDFKTVSKAAKSGAIGAFFGYLTQTTGAFAATDDTFNRVWHVVLNFGDWLALGVFAFCGITWMLGHRTKAIEHFISGATGYIVFHHAKDIRDFLKSI